MHGVVGARDGAPLSESIQTSSCSSHRSHRWDGVLGIYPCVMQLTVQAQSSVEWRSLVYCACYNSLAGFRVGKQLAERYTANRSRTGEPLEVIKFICKEFWVAVFRKQVQCRSVHRSRTHF